MINLKYQFSLKETNNKGEVIGIANYQEQRNLKRIFYNTLKKSKNKSNLLIKGRNKGENIKNNSSVVDLRNHENIEEFTEEGINYPQ